MPIRMVAKTLLRSSAPTLPQGGEVIHACQTGRQERFAAQLSRLK
jgi:hypothetical protein